VSGSVAPLVGRATVNVVQRAMEVAGSGSFYRTSVLERLFRDIQGARYHRPQERDSFASAVDWGLGSKLTTSTPMRPATAATAGPPVFRA
jgi:hypothetical protein